jgi:hypothetical protein
MGRGDYQALYVLSEANLVVNEGPPQLVLQHAALQ